MLRLYLDGSLALAIGVPFQNRKSFSLVPSFSSFLWQDMDVGPWEYVTLVMNHAMSPSVSWSFCEASLFVLHVSFATNAPAYIHLNLFNLSMSQNDTVSQTQRGLVI